MKRSALIMLMISLLFSFSCGIPRAEFEKKKEECRIETEQLRQKINEMEMENKELKELLSEKEAQYSALFFRYESLSREYQKLKRSLTSPDPVL